MGDPPPPQVSPDGRYQWDGARWVPMQAQAPAQPPMAQRQPSQLPPGYASPLPAGYEIRKKGHFWEIACFFECTGFGQSGNFQIYVYGGGSALKDVPANAPALKGSEPRGEIGKALPLSQALSL
jgi:hypothetical protein